MQRVALTIEDDDTRSGGGFARLLFAIDRKPAPAQLKVTFKRGGEAEPWLGPSGWQASEHAFKALSVSTEPQGLSLVVGPEVVNQIEAFTSVMASLPELEVYGVATWEATPGFSVAPPPPPEPEVQEVAFQLLPGGAIAFQAAAEDLGDLTPPARMEPGGAHLGIGYDELRQAFQGRLEIDPKDGSARLLQGPGEPPGRIAFSATANGGLLLKGELHPYKAHLDPGETLFGLESAPLAAMGKGLVDLDPETLTARLVEEPKTDEPPPPEPRKLRWLLPLIVFLLIAGGTAAALVFLDKEETQQAEAEPEEQEPEEKATPSKPTAPTPKELFAKGQSALQAGKFDEARPLLRQAEAAGNREAALLLAQRVDSLGFEAGLFAAPDDIEALRLYGKACAAGEDSERATVLTAAKKDLGALGEALKIKADQGDAIAADTLRGPFKEAEELCQ